MRKSILLIGTLLISFAFSNTGRAQQEYSVVYDLYYDLLQYPENGNDAIARNQGIFGDRFFLCLEELKSRYMEWAQDHYQYCDSVYTEPRFRSDCYQQNEPAKTYQWLRTIGSVTRNQTQWSDTVEAGISIMSKQAVGSDFWLQTIRRMTPPHRPMLVCM